MLHIGNFFVIVLLLSLEYHMEFQTVPHHKAKDKIEWYNVFSFQGHLLILYFVLGLNNDKMLLNYLEINENIC